MAKYNFWSFCQDAVAVAFAVPTYGASMVISPTARGLATKITGLDNDDDSSNKRIEELRLQNDQLKTLIEANREEVKRMRAEKEENDKTIKHNSEEVLRLNAIVNNPHSSEEEKSNARKRIILLEDENKDLKAKNRKLDSDIAEKSQIPVAPSKPWSFPKLSLVDKVLITSGTVLLVYLIIPSKKKE